HALGGFDLVLHVGDLYQALALVFLDDAAVFTREGFELRRVEGATRDDEAVRVVRYPAKAGRGHRGHDVLDVVFDIAAGCVLEFLLAVFVRERSLEPLAKLRVHDLADVRKGHDGGVRGDVTQFGGGSGGRNAWETDLVGDQTSPESGNDDGRRAGH